MSANRKEVEQRIAEKLKDQIRSERFDPSLPVQTVFNDIIQAMNRASPEAQTELVTAFSRNQSDVIGEVLNGMINDFIQNIAEQDAKKTSDECLTVIDRLI